MKIKKIIKQHCPKALLPLLKMPYRTIMYPIRKTKRYFAKKKALKVSWKKISGVNGYQVNYAKKKNVPIINIADL